jgi:hypothetical protein
MSPIPRIEDRLEADFAPAWRPERGEKLVGEVVAISERTGGYGSYPIVTLRRDDGGEVAIHAFHQVLAARLAEVQPKVGEHLGVKYEGEINGGERRYHSYRVVVDRPERPINWSAYRDDTPGATPSDLAAHETGPSEPTAGDKTGDDIPF